MFSDVLIRLVSAEAPDQSHARVWAETEWKLYQMAFRIPAQVLISEENAVLAAQRVIAWSRMTSHDRLQAMQSQIDDCLRAKTDLQKRTLDDLRDRARR